MENKAYEALMKAYFDENSLVKQQIDSYNLFVERKIKEVVASSSVIKTNVEGFEIHIKDVRVANPRHYEVKGGYREILPMEAKWRNLSYTAPVFLKMAGVINGVELTHVPHDVFIGEIPVMVKSKLCLLFGKTREELIKAGEDPDDPGGYFVINGSERVLVSVEDLVPNKVLLSKETEKTEARVLSLREGFRAKCVVRRNKEGFYTVDFPSLLKEVPLVLLVKALSYQNDEKFIESLPQKDKEFINDMLLNMEPFENMGKDEVIENLSKRLSPGQPEEYRMKRYELVINNYLLPHLGIEEKDRKAKALYLMRMAERVGKLAYGKMKADDRDHYGNKRVKLAGMLMEELFRYALQYLIRDIIYQASRAEARGRKLSVPTLVRQNTFSDRIRYAMATGNWVAGQTGISQLLDRVSYMSTLSHLRRIISPLSKKHPHFKARDLHGTHWGKICPSETPEGPSASLVKNMALYAQITTGEADADDVEAIAGELGVKKEWDE
ncbi:MAG: DNA-directed RNA polymerase subunit B'' [Candidatus Anstonellales archaeon]